MRVQDLSDRKESIEGRLCIDVGSSLPQAIGKMHRWGIHHLYVHRDDVIVGLVSDRDIFGKGLMANGMQLNPVMSVGDVYPAQGPIVRGSDDLRAVARAMLDHGTDSVLVKMEGRGFGILTARDLIKNIEGDFADEKSTAAVLLRQAAAAITQNPIVQSAAKILADAGI